MLWNEFKNNFLTIAEKHAPVRQRRVKSEHKPWLTKEIKRLMQHRDYLKRQSVRLTSSNYNEAYKRCKNKLNKLIKKTKEEYFKTKLSNANNSKESWQAINELLNKKPKTTHVTQLNVDHEILLKKLHLYGIKGTTYAWFKSYIQNRKSICLMNGKKSHARDIRCGVPQGSNLGPILFLLYINDLPKCLETCLLMTQIFRVPA